MVVRSPNDKRSLLSVIAENSGGLTRAKAACGSSRAVLGLQSRGFACDSPADECCDSRWETPSSLLVYTVYNQPQLSQAPSDRWLTFPAYFNGYAHVELEMLKLSLNDERYFQSARRCNHGITTQIFASEDLLQRVSPCDSLPHA